MLMIMNLKIFIPSGSPEILKNITVDSYGSKMPINQLSNVNNLDNMTLLINVWDASLVKNFEKSIIDSNLGVSPQTDGNNILLKFPEITKDRRLELVKFISEITEKFKISIRGIRKKYIDEIKSLEKDKNLSIDESKTFQNDIQKITNESILEIESIQKIKETEILKI